MAAERLEARTNLKVERVIRKWAGLRSFVRDKTPVVGRAPEAPGFVWLAGEGGYGIQSSPSWGRGGEPHGTYGTAHGRRRHRRPSNPRGESRPSLCRLLLKHSPSRQLPSPRRR